MPSPKQQSSNHCSNSRPDLAAKYDECESRVRGMAQSVIGEYKYLRPVRVSGTRPPLFYFCPGVPGTRWMLEFMPADLPIYEFYYPNIDGLLAFPTVEELSSIYVEEIKMVQKKGPYQLCGYSHSGLFAYEVGRILLSKGDDVPFLALLETWHPKYHQNLAWSERLKVRLIYVKDRLGKYINDLLHGRLRHSLARAQESVAKHSRMAVWRLMRLPLQRTHRSVPRDMQNVESKVVLQAFAPKPYPNRLMLIRTHDTFQKKIKDQTFGWQGCAKGGVDIRFVDGDAWNHDL